jgi:hypothetical protein
MITRRPPFADQTRLGEAFAGSAPNAAPVNTVMLRALEGYTQLKTTWLDLS